MEVFKVMITGISCAAIFTAIANSFVKTSGVSEILKITSGIATLILFIYPMTNFNPTYEENIFAFSQNSFEENEEISALVNELQISNISNEISSYIENEAASMSIDCTVSVSISIHEEEIIINDLIIYHVDSFGVEKFAQNMADTLGIEYEKILLIKE